MHQNVRDYININCKNLNFILFILDFYDVNVNHDLQALSREDVTHVIVRSTDVAFTRLTAILTVRQTPEAWNALIAISASHVPLARTFSRLLVATLIVHGSLSVARAHYYSNTS